MQRNSRYYHSYPFLYLVWICITNTMTDLCTENHSVGYNTFFRVGVFSQTISPITMHPSSMKPTSIQPTKRSSKKPTIRPTRHPKWGGCVAEGIPFSIQKNVETLVCITLGPLGNWNQGANVTRYTFIPIADDYSKFTIPGCTYTISSL